MRNYSGLGALSYRVHSHTGHLSCQYMNKPADKVRHPQQEQNGASTNYVNYEMQETIGDPEIGTENYSAWAIAV